ncbi:MAG TPA: glycosyltransferase family 4 protein [Streptosporangiaceae bacterium]|jgi:glycosyltransferase involved in cell wall biosynthesis|nr:glycosyltransferase family 4 protein [Streptosporangiaceae bacterium]
MRVVVCTVVHHPADARILHREIRALLDAGHDVTYIAPFRACGVTPWPELTAADVPRAVGRRRLGALRAARRQLARYAPGADLLLVHDPELLLVLPLIRHRPPTIWDVHEDTAASLATKAWLPPALRRFAAAAVLRAEGIAERYLHLLLAETGYNDRFRGTHPVVPNTTYVPTGPAPYDGQARVVYVGHISPDRGASEMVALAELVTPHGVTVELVGSADAQARAVLEPAAAAGLMIRWHGYMPNDEAMLITDGALAGLSLLRDDPNFRHSMPTKVAEYMARGVPVVTTPLPLAAGLVERSECGFIIPFNDPTAASEAVLTLQRDPALRDAMGARGHRDAAQFLRWPEDALLFVAQLERWAGKAGPDAPAQPETAAASVTSPVSAPDDR